MLVAGARDRCFIAGNELFIIEIYKMNTESMRNEMRCETKRKSARKSQCRSVRGKMHGEKRARPRQKSQTKRQNGAAFRCSGVRAGEDNQQEEQKIIKSYVQELMIYGLVSNRQTIEFLSTSSTCQQTFLSFLCCNICSRQRKPPEEEGKTAPACTRRTRPANCTETPTNPTKHRTNSDCNFLSFAF